MNRRFAPGVIASELDRHRWAQVLRRTAVAWGIVAAVCLAASSAYGGVGIGVVPIFPSPVTVGSTNVPASVFLVNTSTPPENAGTLTVSLIRYTPACVADNGPCVAGDADKLVFLVKGPATGRVGTGCAGMTFTSATVDAATGEIQFMPNSGSVVLQSPGASGDSCAIDFLVDVLKLPTNDADPSPGFQTFILGRASATASFDAVTGTGTGVTLTTVLAPTPTATPTQTATGPLATATATPIQLCGNGVREGTEECDDGNLVAGDGCEFDCTFTPETVTEAVSAGGSVTTDPQSTGATPLDPVETLVTSPNAGTVSITESDVTQAPSSGFQTLGQQVVITAPPATATDPLVIVFRIDASQIPAGLNPNAVVLLKDGVAVPDCTGAAGVASPDPCITSRTTLVDGDLLLVVLTSAASTWIAEAPVVCGDHSLAAGEQCDDGNTLNGDGCSATCQIEVPTPPATTTPTATMEKKICAYLGDDRSRFAPDVDAFRFTGQQNESVAVKLEENHLPPRGGHVSLILEDVIRGVRLFKFDASAIPNRVMATLPRSGSYQVIVAEQPLFFPGRPFTGPYCVTLGSSGNAYQSFSKTSSVEP